MLIMSNMGDQVWLMTSRHTDPELRKLAWRFWSYGGNGTIQFIDVWMEDSIYKANAGAFVGILVGKFYMDFPQTTKEGC